MESEQSELPTVVSDGVVEVFGLKIRVFNLSDGKRVIPQNDFDAFLRLLEQEGE